MAHLHVKQGRIKDTQFSLGENKTFVGRDKNCEIYLPEDPADPRRISRRHAVILCAAGRYYIKDGNGENRPSLNGTRLNNERVHLPGRRLLKNGDEIKIWNYVLVFHEDVPQPLADPDCPSTIDMVIPVDDASSVQPAERLASLLTVLNDFRHILELDLLMPQVVESLLKVFPNADRSFLILVDESTGELDARIFKTRKADDGPLRPFNRNVVDECLRNRTGLSSNDHGRAVLCAPLWSDDRKTFGVVLLDRFESRKGFSQEDLNLLLGVANTVSIAFENARHHETALEWEARKRDLVLARDVVKSFLPERLPEVAGYEFFASYESALEVGGDYYDFIPLKNNKMAVLVADVSGHGVAAALVMTRFSAQVQTCLLNEPDLVKAVGDLNTLMQPLGLTDRFITLLVLILDPLTHTVSMVSAGHPPPLLLRATGELEELHRHISIGLPLGVLEGSEYEAHQLALQAGETLVLYSDGMLDAMDINDRSFGLRGFRGTLSGTRASPRELGEQLLRAVDRHAAGCRQHDDTTLVCIGHSCF